MNKVFNIGLLVTSFILLGLFYKSILIVPAKNYQVSLINKDNSIEVKELEDYLIGVIACEMPASYPDEALRAQAIASRTYALYKSKNNISLATTTDDQCFINDEEMHTKWGNDYQKYLDKITNAVLNTKSIIIKKDNQLFKTFYFSTSNGFTEDSLAVFNEAGLSSVESSWDKESSNYKRETSFSKNELINLLGNFNNIKIVNRSNTNHVEKVMVDNKEYTGVEFRKLLGLRSTDFTIDINNDSYLVTTYGYGHGVGMSQYGASYLAKNGKTYQDILSYYYGNISFEKI